MIANHTLTLGASVGGTNAGAKKGRHAMSRSIKALGLVILVLMLLMLLPANGRAQQGTIVPTPSPLPSATPTPRPESISRSFHCNCTSAGQPVLWAGFVQAMSYFQARQLATTQCLAYIGEKPASPLIPTPAPAVGFGAPPTFAPLAINPCSQCACN
jgi:hypothetical protein